MMSRASLLQKARADDCPGTHRFPIAPSRNIRALIDSFRMVQSSSRSRSCRGLPATPARPVLHGSQTHTEGMAQFGLVSPKCSRSCRVRLAEETLHFLMEARE